MGAPRRQTSASQGSLLGDTGGAKEGKGSHSLVRRILDSVSGLVSAVVPERFSTSAERKVGRASGAQT